ncbi:hypothetical protein CF319_g7448 [Tilletia indica]|nr:hypothetical protein CF319_g7448 [Tilletia indica]
MARSDFYRRPQEVDDGGSDLEMDSDDDSVEYEEEGPLVDLGKELAAARGEMGEYSFGGHAYFLPSLPGLFIEGVGKIALPLVDEELAEKIIKVCEQAPFGRGSDTLVDTSVRNSWQLDPSKVKLENPGWNTGIKAAAPLIAAKFGVGGTPITLHLYKFLLYKVGGHFAKHRDTEKEDRMFATMVVQLPSAHKGGQLQVFKDDEKDPIIHDFGAAAGKAEYHCNYAVHFADSEHAVQPITEGYRLALVYSICWPAKSNQPAPSLSRDKQTPMLEALAELADDDREFHYYFEHAYTPKSISELGAGCLKGQDRARVANLRTVNATLPSHQQFNFYLVRGQRTASYFGSGGPPDDCDWEEVDDSKSYSFTSLTGLDGRVLVKSAIHLDDANVLNPDDLTKRQRWRGHRTITYEGYLGNEGPTKDTRYEKYLLLAWPTKTAEDRILALAGVKSHFTSMLSAGANPDAVRKFVQRVAKMKAAGTFKPESENAFGRALYKHLASVSNLKDLFPVYFDLFPHGTHVPKSSGSSAYLYRSDAEPATPFMDIIQVAQQSDSWDTLEDKVIDAFAGQTLLILDLMEEVKKSTVLQTEMKDQIVKKLLGLFPHQISSSATPEGRSKEVLQRKLWSAVVATEGSDSFNDLARTYIAYFPQGAHANSQPYDNQRFKDLLRLAASSSAWEAISTAVIKAFDSEMEGALSFVRSCIEHSLPRTVWRPFLDIALKISEVQAPKRWSGISSSSRPALLKAMRKTAMMLDSPTEDNKSDSDDAAKLLTHYIAMIPIGIDKSQRSSKTPAGNADFSDLIQIARKFPSVWETSKGRVLRAIGSDMKLALQFIKQCRLANLPEGIWGSSVEACAKVDTLPADTELNDEALQDLLWQVAIDLPGPDLCQALVTRYMAVPIARVNTARSALITNCKADLRSFKSKRTVLEPLLQHWLQAMEMSLQALQKSCTDANNWIFSAGSIPTQPGLKAFLRGSQKSTNLVGFESISAAREAASKITFKNCSGTAEALGRGKGTFVLVTKTPSYARQLEEERQRKMARYEAFQALLSNLDEGDEAGPSKKQKVEES